jgi:hypothetical protein
MSNNDAALSELEREFELEMDGAPEGNLEVDFESLPDDSEFELVEGSALQDEGSFVLNADVEQEFGEGPNGNQSSEYVERFLEISGRQFESPYEADAAMGEVLDDIEREYFFGAIKRGLKKLGKNKLLNSLAKKGLSLGVNKFLPGLQGALQLARGNVKGALLNFGKQALGSVVPGGGAVLDAVKSIGLVPAGGEAMERETWENYVNLSREAYEHLAENLTPTADQPAEAMRLANNAVQHAIAKAKVRTAGRSKDRGKVVRLRVSPGERIRFIVVGG